MLRVVNSKQEKEKKIKQFKNINQHLDKALTFFPEIHQDWEFSPVKLTFQANQSGSAIMYARPKEDDIVEGTERFVLSLKRISNRMVSYVKSKLVEIIDDDSKCHKSYKGSIIISYK